MDSGTQAIQEEQPLTWANAKEYQARYLSLNPFGETETSLETLQPSLDDFAQKLASGYAGESPAVQERKEREAEQVRTAESKGVLQKARQAANDMLGVGVWDAAVDAIASYCGGDEIHAQFVLARAFNWQAWIEMNQPSYFKPTPPPPVEQLRTSLTWLREGPLAMTEDELKSALLAQPVPYMTSPEKNYKAARSCAPEQWRDPKVFRELLRIEPKVLQLTWNCCYTDPLQRDRVLGLDAQGESFHCDAECRTCWRAVTPGLMGLELDGCDV